MGFMDDMAERFGHHISSLDERLERMQHTLEHIASRPDPDNRPWPVPTFKSFSGNTDATFRVEVGQVPVGDYWVIDFATVVGLAASGSIQINGVTVAFISSALMVPNFGIRVMGGQTLAIVGDAANQSVYVQFSRYSQAPPQSPTETRTGHARTLVSGTGTHEGERAMIAGKPGAVSQPMRGTVPVNEGSPGVE